MTYEQFWEKYNEIKAQTDDHLRDREGKTMDTVITLAKELQEYLTRSTREDDTTYVHLKDGYPQWMKDVIREAHGDRLPDDDVYERIEDIIDTLSDIDDDASEDEIQERIDGIEPDVYTSDLTEWLNARNDNVYYLTEALEEMEIKDGFQLLAYAQSIYIREIANTLISELQKLVDEQEED